MDCYLAPITTAAVNGSKLIGSRKRKKETMVAMQDAPISVINDAAITTAMAPTIGIVSSGNNESATGIVDAKAATATTANGSSLMDPRQRKNKDVTAPLADALNNIVDVTAATTTATGTVPLSTNKSTTGMIDIAPAMIYNKWIPDCNALKSKR